MFPRLSIFFRSQNLDFLQTLFSVLTFWIRWRFSLNSRLCKLLLREKWFLCIQLQNKIRASDFWDKMYVSRLCFSIAKILEPSLSRSFHTVKSESHIINFALYKVIWHPSCTAKASGIHQYGIPSASSHISASGSPKKKSSSIDALSIGIREVNIQHPVVL